MSYLALCKDKLNFKTYNKTTWHCWNCFFFLYKVLIILS